MPPKVACQLQQFSDKSQSAAEPYFAHFQTYNLRFMIRNGDCYRLNGDKIIKRTSLALHNAHCFSSPLAMAAEKKGWAKRGPLVV